MPADRQLKVVWICPDISLMSTKAAYVSSRLLPLLDQDFAITVVSGPRGIESCFAKDFDLVFLQIEDRPSSLTLAACFSEQASKLCVPLIVLCHDLYLRPTGERTARFAVHKLLQLSERVLFSSVRNLGAHYHSESRERESREAVTVKGCYLPYPVDPFEVIKASECDSKEIRIAYCGTTLLEDRAYRLLSAFSKYGKDLQLHWMLDDEQRVDAEALCDEFGIVSYEFYGGCCAETWLKVLSLSQIVFHTRFSAYGDFGQYFGMSLMAGLPVAVANFAEGAELPDDIVYKIRLGELEESDILRLVEGYRDGEQSITRIAQLGREYAEEFFDSRVVASDLLAVFREEVNFEPRALAMSSNL